VFFKDFHTCEKVKKKLIVIKSKSVVLTDETHELSVFIRLQKVAQFCEHFVPVVEVLLCQFSFDFSKQC